MLSNVFLPLSHAYSWWCLRLVSKSDPNGYIRGRFRAGDIVIKTKDFDGTVTTKTIRDMGFFVRTWIKVEGGPGIPFDEFEKMLKDSYDRSKP